MTFNSFILGGWDQTDTRGVDVAAGSQLLAGSEDVPTPGISRKLRITIRPEDFHGNELLAPGLGDQRGPAGHGAPDRRRRLVHRGRGTRGTGQYTVDSDVLELTTPRRSAATC